MYFTNQDPTLYTKYALRQVLKNMVLEPVHTRSRSYQYPVFFQEMPPLLDRLENESFLVTATLTACGSAVLSRGPAYHQSRSSQLSVNKGSNSIECLGKAPNKCPTQKLFNVKTPPCHSNDHVLQKHTLYGHNGQNAYDITHQTETAHTASG